MAFIEFLEHLNTGLFLVYDGLEILKDGVKDEHDEHTLELLAIDIG